MTDKNSFISTLAAELNAMERQIDALEADVRADRPTADESLPDALRKRLEMARERIRHLGDAEDHEWEVHREKAESAWQDLRKAFAQTRSRLGD
jgi:hypothetical protein